MKIQTLVCSAFAVIILATSAVAAAHDNGGKTTLYFTRHENDQSKWVTIATGTQQDTCIANRACCEQVLNPLGETRAAQLAAWFDAHNLTRDIDQVIATSKPRTVATVAQIAANAGLHNDVDLIPDGVQQIPADQIECDLDHPEYYDATATMQPLYDYLRTLPQGSTVVVATHSTTLYQILARFGIDVLSDPQFFPVDLPAGATTCDPFAITKSGPVDSRGCKVLGFDNLWKVVIDRKGNAQATDHWVLDLDMTTAEHDRN